MNAIAIGPLVFSNDRFVAVLTIIAFLGVAEILAWRSPDNARSIHRWTGAIGAVWIIAARIGFVINHWDAFAPAPSSMFAIWQGGFDPVAGTVAAGLLLAFAFVRRSVVRVPVVASTAAALLVFGAATLLLPDQTGGRIPAAGFADLSGVPVALDETEGRPLVLNLWASWCPPCRREMPMMVDVAQTQNDVAIIFANQGESTHAIHSFLETAALSQAGMVQDPNMTLMHTFGMLGLPSTLFFAADGSLQSVHTGEISRAALLAGIKDLKP